MQFTGMLGNVPETFTQVVPASTDLKTLLPPEYPESVTHNFFGSSLLTAIYVITELETGSVPLMLDQVDPPFDVRKMSWDVDVYMYAELDGASASEDKKVPVLPVKPEEIGVQESPASKD